MSASVKTRTVSLRDDHPHRRGIHTVHLPDDSLGRDEAGNAKRTIQVPFLNGTATVPDQVAAQLKSLGHIK